MEKGVKRTIKTYNEIAEIYDRLQYTTDVREDIIKSFLRAFQGQYLLDVGCGPGNDTGSSWNTVWTYRGLTSANAF